MKSKVEIIEELHPFNHSIQDRVQPFIPLRVCYEAMELYANQSRWISVETPPMEGKQVLLLGRDNKIYLGYFTTNLEGQKFWKTDVYYSFSKVVGWMPTEFLTNPTHTIKKER